MNKILSKQELLQAAEEARRNGQTIVHCHGCFDIVHPGHVRYLEFAKRQGHRLVVSLTGDSQILKGDQRPYIPEELRAENLAALQMVDWVYINPYPTAVELLRELQPDIYVKGREYEHSHDPNFLAEQEAVGSYGGRVQYSSGEVVFSSSRLMETVESDTSIESERTSLVCRRHGIDAPKLLHLLQNCANLRILVVGDLILDKYVLCDATELASEAAMMSLSRLEEREYIGGAGVVARHAAALGAETYLLSSTAEDEASWNARGILENESIQTCLIPCRNQLPTKTRFLVETSKLLRLEDGNFQPLDSVSEQQATDWAASVSDGFEAVIFCDFGYGTITGGLLTQLQARLKNRIGVQVADVSGPRSRLLRFQNVDLLCPTERELRSAMHDFEEGLSSVAWNVLHQTQARQMLVTLGKKGVVTFDRQSQDHNALEWQGRLRSEYFPSLADRVVDPLGCGDSLLTGAAATLAAGGNLMQSAYLGSAAAAMQIERLGNLPLDSEKLRHWLTARPELKTASSRIASEIESLNPETTLQRIASARLKEENVDLLARAQQWRVDQGVTNRKKLNTAPD